MMLYDAQLQLLGSWQHSQASVTMVGTGSAILGSLLLQSLLHIVDIISMICDATAPSTICLQDELHSLPARHAIDCLQTLNKRS